MGSANGGQRSTRPGPSARRRASRKDRHATRHSQATQDDGIRANGATDAQGGPASLPSGGQIHQGEGARPGEITRATHRQLASPFENGTQIKHDNPQVKAPGNPGAEATRRLGAPGPDQRAPGRRGQRRRRCRRAAPPYKPRPARRRPTGQTATRRNPHRPARKPTSPGKPRKRPTAGPGRATARAKTGKRAKGDHRDARPARPTPTRNGARATPRARRRWRERKGSKQRKKKPTWRTPKAGQPRETARPVAPPGPGASEASPNKHIIAHAGLKAS